MDYAYLADLYGGGYSQYGGNDFTEDECRQWLANNFMNPRTGRQIGPTKSGRGVYHDLQRACAEAGYTLQQAPPIRSQPLRTTPAGREIIRSTAKGRKSPAVSATSLPVGTQRMGEDGQMYIVKLRSNNTQYWQPCSQSTANC